MHEKDDAAECAFLGNGPGGSNLEMPEGNCATLWPHYCNCNTTQFDWKVPVDSILVQVEEQTVISLDLVGARHLGVDGPLRRVSQVAS